MSRPRRETALLACWLFWVCGGLCAAGCDTPVQVWQTTPDGARPPDAATRDAATLDGGTSPDAARADAHVEDPERIATLALAQDSCDWLRRCQPEIFNALANSDLAYCVRDMVRRDESRIARGHHRRDIGACVERVRGSTGCMATRPVFAACEWLPGPTPLSGRCLTSDDCGVDTDGRRLVCTAECDAGVCVRPVEVGAACVEAVCDSWNDEVCRLGDAAPECVHVPVAPLGGACGELATCDGDAYCNEAHVCAERLADGEVCPGRDACAGAYSQCTELWDGVSRCVRFAHAFVAAGDPCVEGDACGISVCTEGRCPSDCRDGLRCHPTHACDETSGECVYVSECHGR